MKKYSLLFTTFLSTFAFAQKDEDAMDTIKKTFEIQGVKTILINNNNKNVIVKTWKKNTVQLTAIMMSDNNSTKENYSFNTKMNGNVFKIYTDINKEPSRYNAGGEEGASVSNGNRKISVHRNETIITNNARGSGEGGSTTSSAISTINGNKGQEESYSYSYNSASCRYDNEEITITIPENIALDIDNSFGNVAIEDNVIEVKADIQSGTFSTKDVQKMYLEGAYSNFEFGEIAKAEMDVKSSNFTIAKIDDLQIDTKFCNFEFDNIAKLLVQNSQSDNFDITELGEMEGDFSFSNFKIQKLIKSIRITANSGTFKIKNVVATATSIEIAGKYTEIDVNLRNVSAYKLNAKTTFSSIRANGKFLDTDATEQKYFDTKGDGGNMNIILMCNSCTIALK